ncbi:MAG: helix-turn-helix transcriptional regulator [Prevotella sp.]|nr:helix-turn-helix transcriptional regulator [Prevotella sp.]
MKDIIDEFFVPIMFKGRMSDEDYQKIRPCIDAIDAFARSSNMSVYVIDYFKQNFLYVSKNPLLLNGHSPEEIARLGYMYYRMFVPETELELLQEINRAGFSFYHNTSLEDRMKYTISYDFHILNKNKRKILINHKLTPMILNPHGQIWLAMCTVTLSSRSLPGKITINKIDDDVEYVYSPQSKKWLLENVILLSERETEILRYSAQGLSNSEIAEKIFVDVNTIKFHKKNIFSTFNVHTIAEAVAFATNKNLI